jgi:hypothetical protein
MTNKDGKNQISVFLRLRPINAEDEIRFHIYSQQAMPVVLQFHEWKSLLVVIEFKSSRSKTEAMKSIFD